MYVGGSLKSFQQ